MGYPRFWLSLCARRLYYVRESHLIGPAASCDSHYGAPLEVSEIVVKMLELGKDISELHMRWGKSGDYPVISDWE